MEEKTPKIVFPEEIVFTTTPPWGYSQVENTKKGVINPEQMEVLREALIQLENAVSLRQVVEFIKGKGYAITRPTLAAQWRKYVKKSVIRADQKRAREIRKEAKRPKLTPEQLTRRKHQLAMAAEKRRITAAKKRLDKLKGIPPRDLKKDKEVKKLQTKSVVETSDLISNEDIEEVKREIIFQPNDGPQTDFLSAPEQEVLFGGAAGGGKSFGLLADPIRYFEKDQFSGLLVRKTNDELRELVWKSKLLYPKIFPKATFSEKASEWRFPSGAKLWMSYLDRDDDLLRYQGQAYSWIGFDELTHWNTPNAWNYLRSRLRAASGSGLDNAKFMRATTNPGGPGHGWVKQMFIDPAPYGEPFWARDQETGEILIDPETKEPLFQRRFIPSKLEDNPYLSEGGEYRRNLLSLPEAQRRKLLEGDWSIVEGAAFNEFRHNTHVVEPFKIPNEWSKFRAMDYGYAAPSAVLWIAVDPQDAQLIVYRELYVNKTTAKSLAYTIRSLEKDERINYGVLDSSVWHKRGEGPSIAEVMISHGCRWRASDRSAGSRIAGKNRLHELLKVDEFTDRPGIIFFNTCRNIIADLPVIPSDPKGTDDIDPRFQRDHTYDALRYGIMSRPRPNNFFGDDYISRPIEASDATFGY